MKILRLDLTAFGPFVDQTLDLSEGQQGLHLIHGPNEAGKSSTLRALRQVLFGIDSRTSDDFRITYKKLRLGATLVDHLGNELSFERLKKNKNSLCGANGEQLSDNCLDPFLGHLNQKMFEDKFGLDWKSLEEGGLAIVESKGDLGGALFAAGSGLTTLTKVQNAIDKEMKDLFLPTGSKPKINELLNGYDVVKEKLREVRLSSQEMKRHQETREEAEQKKQDISQQKKSRERERSRLQRIKSAKLSIHKFRDTSQELETLKHVVPLPDDFSDSRLQALQQLSSAQQSETALGKEISRLTDQIKHISIDQNLLDQAAEIESLYKQTEQYLSSVEDYPIVNSECLAANKEARQLLKEIRGDFRFENVEELRILEDDRVAIRDLGLKFESLSNQAESAEREILDAKDELAGFQEQQTEQVVVPDLAGLQSAVKRAEKRGPLEDNYREAKAAMTKAETRAEKDGRALQFWSGTLEELEQLEVPLRETLTQFQNRFDAADKKREDVAQKLVNAQKSQEEIAEAFEKLELEGEVPTEDDLIAARELREQGWRLIVRSWRDAEDAPQDVKAFLSELDASDLEAGFQKAVAKADAVSDRLRQQASRVSEKQRLLVNRKAIQEKLPLLATQLADCEKEWQVIEAAWRELWAPSNVEPATPAEMKEWLQSHAGLMKSVETLHSQKQHLAAIRELIDEHRSQLILELKKVSPQLAASSEMPLWEIIEQSQTVLDGMSKQQGQQTLLRKDIERLEQQLPKLDREYKTAQTKLADWQKQWTKLMRQLGRDENATPQQAIAILEKLDRMFNRLKQESLDAARAKNMLKVNQQFEERAEAVVQTLGTDSKDATPPQVVNHLHAEVARERQSKNKRSDLETELEGRQREKVIAEQQMAASRAILMRMCQDAGCKDPEQLPKAEADSAKKTQLEKQQKEHREQIMQFVGEAAFDEFLEEAAAEDTDALDSELAELDQQLEELEEEHTQSIEHAVELQNILDTKSGCSQAAEAEEDKQSLLAEIRIQLERYVQLRLAARAIREGAERYRKKHQGPVLSRAGELFRMLTCDSFLRLHHEGDDQGKPHLVGVRQHAGSEEYVRVTGMSDGTADQLYLALRIALLEDWLDHHPAIPFVVDDILVNFDDQRAVAALQVLAELSKRTQVIFFTHHAHLVELAEKHLPRGVCFTHELGQAKSRGNNKPQATENKKAAKLF